MEVLLIETQIGTENPTENAGPYKQVIESAQPLPETPEFAVMLQHDAQIAKRVFKKEKSIPNHCQSPLPDCTVDRDKYIERYGFVLCFLDAVP